MEDAEFKKFLIVLKLLQKDKVKGTYKVSLLQSMYLSISFRFLFFYNSILACRMYLWRGPKRKKLTTRFILRRLLPQKETSQILVPTRLSFKSDDGRFQRTPPSDPLFRTLPCLPQPGQCLPSSPIFLMLTPPSYPISSHFPLPTPSYPVYLLAF